LVRIPVFSTGGSSASYWSGFQSHSAHLSVHAQILYVSYIQT
jgi:hypothetical protein